MYPESMPQKENIINEDKEIKSLVEQKSMPWLSDILGVEECRHAKHELRCDDGNTGTYCDPGENVHHATRVALSCGTLEPELLDPLLGNMSTRSSNSQGPGSAFSALK
jgi:hypothetical protein